ncbi:hypothetical protein GCM10010169_06230 [Micromonospora fulviviridis]|uniref:hypothetical protein n=1 Tax=Micromonospora fulviviridis TaxID=47860 RepID=UPI00166E7DB9|nr:hypothetical protein [Micromonospora fulviviridis]GGR65630.1 hypothetical protein GCM10010169_06230 [Micromonospora fulviviridis]
MKPDDALPDLMVGGDLPNGHLPAPLPADRARRRGRGTLAVAAAAIGLALLGSFFVRQQRATDPVAPRQVSAQEASEEAPSTLAWLSALVARDGRSVTVYAGASAECNELVQPRAAVAEQDGTRVVIAVKARMGRATDCATSGEPIPLVVSLPEPLGDRVLRDAATALPPPTYFERDLPALSSDERWSPHPGQWASTDDGWYQGYNGPGGSHLLAAARRTADASRPAAVATLTIGARKGVITGGAEGSWTLWWVAGEVTYSLRLTPAEGSTFTLKQFKREMGRLNWS